MSQTSPYLLQSLQIDLDGIGPVLLERSRKAKRISIKLQPLKGVRVIIPYAASFEEGQRFLQAKRNWVQQHLPRIEKQENERTIFDESTIFRTFSHQLQLIPHAASTLKARLAQGQLQVFYPDYRNVADTAVQEYIRKVIQETYRLEAKQFLPERVHYFAQKFNLQYNKVVIKKASTRWGSCSYQNNINLNLHLMRLPEHLRDYVILHELAHTIEKNHGPRFWALLEKISGNAVGLDKEMRHYRIDIF